METNRLIRVLKFLGFVRAATGEHEEGRGFRLYVIQRPELALRWNAENDIMVVYDSFGNPWIHIRHIDITMQAPETTFDACAHVPHAYGKHWIEGQNSFTDAEREMFEKWHYYPTSKINAMLQKAANISTDSTAERILRSIPRHINPKTPITDQELEEFEQYLAIAEEAKTPDPIAVIDETPHPEYCPRL
ncbi:MAG TPA: hypothetical protein PLV72_00650 [Candidatus Magasanikbacteria bacterium]|nr:hypothetical protein [Candidatus Magasanikbacteria bacterium]